MNSFESDAFSIDAGATNGSTLFLPFVSAEAGAHILPVAADQGVLVPNLSAKSAMPTADSYVIMIIDKIAYFHRFN